MAFCENCGNQLGAGERFCTNCGSPPPCDTWEGNRMNGGRGALSTQHEKIQESDVARIKTTFV